MFYDVVGWVGMILVLVAYVLLSTNKIKNGYLYQWLNFFCGAIDGDWAVSEKRLVFVLFASSLGDSCVNCDRKIIAKETNEEKE